MLIPLNRAITFGQEIIENLKPHCEEIEFAGSIRRKKQAVKDIEIICIPKTTMHEVDELFFNKITELRDNDFVKKVNNYSRGAGDGYSKYVKILLTNIKCDLFIANTSNYGLIKMIRTGSAEYSKRIVSLIKQNGYHSEGGYLIKGDDIVPCRTEEDFYKLTGLKYIPPEFRN